MHILLFGAAMKGVLKTRNKSIEVPAGSLRTSPPQLMPQCYSV